MNKQVTNKNLFQRHWKWLTPLIIVIFVVFMISPIDNSITDIAKVYADSSIYENALIKAKLNNDVIKTLGVLEPIDKFTIAEGFVKYSSNNTKIIITVRLKGSKGKGKLDIAANKVDYDWKYQTISIRIKEPKATIVVLQ